MLEQFTEYLQKEHLCKPGEAILLSVSGGPDSVLLTFLFRMAGYSFGMAHCNYQLRGDESDADEAFVAHLAGQWNVPFYLLRVPTRQMALEQGRSIQEVARDARYDEWDTAEELFIRMTEAFAIPEAMAALRAAYTRFLSEEYIDPLVNAKWSQWEADA